MNANICCNLQNEAMLGLHQLGNKYQLNDDTDNNIRYDIDNLDGINYSDV